MGQPAPRATDTPEPRILIVDDERANVVLLERVLDRAGYAAVRSTTDSRTVEAVLDEWQPDLILLDLMMPDPDGFTILADVMRRPADRRMPVLVLTASGMSDVKKRAFEVGASDFLTKPFDHAEVLLRIRNLLATRALEHALRAQNQSLELRVAQRTSALTHSLAELQRSMDQRQVLMDGLVSAQEEERRRIASDIHDDTIQAMVAAAMNIERLRRGSLGQPMADELDGVISSVRDAIARLRDLLFDVHPATLERDGLAASLQACLERMKANGGPTFTLTVAGEDEPTPAERATLYRVAQEALANVRKHAAATHVEIAVRIDGDGTTLRIADDGRGFDARAMSLEREGHLGMTTMRERVGVAGGVLRVDSTPGAGTVLEVRLPKHVPGGRSPDDASANEAPAMSRGRVA